MGCGVSKIPPSDIPTDLLDTNDPPETNLMWADADEAIEEFADDGEPGCAIGTQCKAFEPGKRNVVILFGGVGSHKGDLTDLMASEYSFQLICMEELVSKHSKPNPNPHVAFSFCFIRFLFHALPPSRVLVPGPSLHYGVVVVPATKHRFPQPILALAPTCTI